MAKNNHISEYGDLGSEARVSIWKNFVTVVLTFLLLVYSRNLYTIDDYDSVVPYKAQYNEDGAEEERAQMIEWGDDNDKKVEEKENK